MRRRDFLPVLGALGVVPLTAWGKLPRAARRSFDVVVIGAGVFGMWTAAHLKRAGKSVAVIDAVGPAHSAASSGGESRVTRCGYGAESLYTDWACRSMAEWRALSQRSALPLFHETGVLWIHRDGAEFFDANAKMLARYEVPFTRLSTRELTSRFPILHADNDERGFFEPRGGALMARRAVQQLAVELEDAGVTFLRGRAEPIRIADGVGGALPTVTTPDGKVIEAEQFVVACGPWLDRVCPDAMAGRLFVTRQEVLFFAVDGGQTGALPVWADLPYYGMPSLEGRGFKVANDTHGAEVDIGAVDRHPTAAAEEDARSFLARRFPSLADRPLNEVRVCQYENSSNGDFVLDRHPGLGNVWLAGCGSGHGFKHGPAIGAHLAGLVLGTERPIERFGLASKQTRHKREIQ